MIRIRYRDQDERWCMLNHVQCCLATVWQPYPVTDDGECSSSVSSIGPQGDASGLAHGWLPRWPCAKVAKSRI